MLKLPAEEKNPSGGTIPYSSPTEHPQGVWQPGLGRHAGALAMGLMQHQLQHSNRLGCCGVANDARGQAEAA